MFIAGILFITIGISVLSFFGIRKLVRYVNLQKLLNENIVVEIPDINIKAPVIEEIDQEVLRIAVGHFPDTGEVGKGNFCIAGHSSVIYKEFFNDLKNVQNGLEIRLYDKAKRCYRYAVEDSFIVEPNEVWILQDFGDDRITIVTCTDDGSQRLVVIGKLKEYLM